MSIKLVHLSALTMIFASTAGADDQLTELKPPTPLPAGTPVPHPTGIEVPIAGYYRQSRMANWQYYAVDRQGYFRPRVILAPEPYFLFNGAPYGLLSVKPQSYIPHLVD